MRIGTTMTSSTSMGPTRTTKCLASGIQAIWFLETRILTDAPPPTETGTPRIPKYVFTSGTFTLGLNTAKESTWRIVLNPFYMEKGTRYISLHFQLLDLKTSGSAKEYVETIFDASLLHPTQNLPLIEVHDYYCRKMDPEIYSTFGWNKFMKFSAIGSDPHPVMAIGIEVTTTTDPEPLRDINAVMKSFGAMPSSSVEITEVTTNDEDLPPATAASNNGVPDEKEPDKDLPTMVFKVAFQILWKKRYTEGWENADCLVHSESKCLAAHVLPLVLKSPKIKAMVDEAGGGFTPTKDEPFNLLCQEWPDEVMEAILEYCYTGELTQLIVDTHSVWQLAQASVFYKIDGLDKLSREMFLLRTNVETYLDIYECIGMVNSLMMTNLEEEALSGSGEGGEAGAEMERLRNYDKSDFLQELLGLRKEYPWILGDYKDNLKEYSQIIFERWPRHEQKEMMSDHGELDTDDEEGKHEDMMEDPEDTDEEAMDEL